MGFVKVAKTNDLKHGQMKSVNAEGKNIALFNVDGKFYALDNKCVHKGGPLGEGELDGDIVSCPWHGWKFNVKTGVSPVNPTAKQPPHAIKIQGDDILVEV